MICVAWSSEFGKNWEETGSELSNEFLFFPLEDHKEDLSSVKEPILDLKAHEMNFEAFKET
jgi:hypothetical protein